MGVTVLRGDPIVAQIISLGACAEGVKVLLRDGFTKQAWDEAPREWIAWARQVIGEAEADFAQAKEAFLYGSGSGSGSGYGYGTGEGYGSGYGYGHGTGEGEGYGYGYVDVV